MGVNLDNDRIANVVFTSIDQVIDRVTSFLNADAIANCILQLKHPVEVTEDPLDNTPMAQLAKSPRRVLDHPKARGYGFGDDYHGSWALRLSRGLFSKKHSRRHDPRISRSNIVFLPNGVVDFELQESR
jgi:hypothetical protein